ncbi:hypothetical protein C8J57DRAFT_1576773 [Mycena rebaudengoi]|nr:hypothetical protein C8J57DRAFT_1576773 [Mycena rebaudengoi]
MVEPGVCQPPLSKDGGGWMKKDHPPRQLWLLRDGRAAIRNRVRGGGGGIDSSPRSLRSTLLRALRLELLEVHQNPDNLLDTDDFFVQVPDHLAHHNNLSPSALAPLFQSTPPPESRLPSPISSSTMAAVPPAQMPARGDRNTPQFDSSKPRELPRYFSDLEFHFTRVGITDATEKKGHSTRFLSVEEQDIWESLDEFKPTSTYEQFKAAVLKLEFYRQFLVITQFLISRQRLSIAEQCRSFRRAIAPAHLWARVHQRLQIKKPDVHPDDPYELADLHEAVQFVLSDTSSGRVATDPSNSPPASSSAPEIKQEPGISALLESMNGLIKVLTAQQQQLQRPPQSQSSSPRTDLNCSYCSEPGHFIIKCPHVDEDIQVGKCKRDTEGRVTLPSGAFVPHHVEGRNLRVRIEEWHRQNPGQIAAAQLMLELATKHLLSPSTTTSTTTFTLSEEERIKSLEHEIFALRTRSQARKAAAAGEPVETPEQPIRITAPAPPALVRDTTTAPETPPLNAIYAHRATILGLLSPVMPFQPLVELNPEKLERSGWIILTCS